MPLRTLIRGHHFGKRALFKEDEYTHIEEKGRIVRNYYGPARVSVIADSPNVEIVELEKDRLSYIPEHLRVKN